MVMAAAVADYRPAHYTDVKIKKSFDARAGEASDSPASPDEAAPTIQLVRNPDVLAELVAARGSATWPVIVGFAAETGDSEHTVLDLAREKFVRKGCDVLVANEVGLDKTFGDDTTTVHILRRGLDAVTDVGPASKHAVAATLWDLVQDILTSDSL